MQTLNASPQQKGIPVNPLLKKLETVYEDEANAASYMGIYKKCLFFLGMTALGVMLAAFFRATGAITVNPAADELFVDKLVIWLLLGSLTVFIVFPFLAFLLRVTIPVTGSVYCFCVGYVFGFFAMLDDSLGGCILLALVLTLALVAVMGFLFAKGYIRVSAKFRAITTATFGGMVLGSVLLLVCCLVPSLRQCVLALAANPLLTSLASIGGLVIAVIFLLVDFDNIRQVVEGNLPKEYEWYASFGLVFTVVWVYLKVLHLVLQAKN